jgi:hypothetical protein
MKYILSLSLLFLSFFSFGLITPQQYVEVGSNNYINNGGYEYGITGYSRYYNGAVAVPTSGTGGTLSANFTHTVTTTNPLFGKTMGLWTKSGLANAIGYGFSYDFTTDIGDKSRTMGIKFSYQVVSGTYADGDMTVWLYDGTNIIPVDGDNRIMGCAVGPCKFETTYQATTSTSYRLIIHTKSASTQNYSLNFDGFEVSKRINTNGAFISPKTSFTPSFSAAWGTVSNLEAFYTRIGDQAEITISVKAGTVAASQPCINISSIGRVDNTKLASGDRAFIGDVSYTQNPTNPAGLLKADVVFFTSLADTTIICVAKRTNLTGYNPDTTGAIFGSNDFIFLKAKVPILGWTTNTLQSTPFTNRFITAEFYNNTTTSCSAGQPINYDVKVADSVNAVTTGSGWRFTAPETGRYLVTVSWQGIIGGVDTNFVIYKNASPYRILENVAAGSNKTYNWASTVTMIASDYIDIRPNQNVSSMNVTLNVITISKLSQPETISAAEPVMATYTGSPAGTPSGSALAFKLPTKLIDTHGAYNPSTGEWTAPRSGYVETCYQAMINGTGISTSTYISVEEVKNGSLVFKTFSYERYSPSEFTTAMQINRCMAPIPVNTGDTVRLDFIVSGFTTPTWEATTTYSSVSFYMK